MSKKNDEKIPASPVETWDDEEYSDMELLEMLESVREDMEELGVNTLQEVIVRIDELHQRLDARS